MFVNIVTELNSWTVMVFVSGVILFLKFKTKKFLKRWKNVAKKNPKKKKAKIVYVGNVNSSVELSWRWTGCLCLKLKVR